MQDRRIRRRGPSAPLIMSTMALIASLGGSATAAAVLITKPSQLADKVVTAPKLADAAVTRAAVAPLSVEPGDLTQPVVAAGVNKGIGPTGEPFLINPTREVE